jgi:hypothetical protein
LRKTDRTVFCVFRLIHNATAKREASVIEYPSPPPVHAGPAKKLHPYVTVMAAFAGVALLLIAAGYVIHRLVSDRAYYEKWKLYDTCGWA